VVVEEGVTRFDGVLVDGTDVEKPFSARDRRSFRRREDAESNLDDNCVWQSLALAAHGENSDT